MDWYPLLNSLRIAAISTFVIFFAGIFAAYYIAKLPRILKGILDIILTLPLVLPPTVVGYLLLRVLGPKRVIGAWVLRVFGFKMVMTWWSAIFATIVVIFPLMYRTVRGAFESFDETLSYAGKTPGLSNAYIFWRIRMPYCRQGILAGTVLAFARALGEYGATSMIAGYTPGKTATISTTVYQLWRTDQDAEAFKWVLINVAISAIVLLAVNMLERRNTRVRVRQEGCVRGWNLPPFTDNRGAATLAVPQSALDFDGTDYRFSVLRVISDAGHEILLLRLESADADAPILRAECPSSTMAAAGQSISLSFRREKLLFF